MSSQEKINQLKERIQNTVDNVEIDYYLHN